MKITKTIITSLIMTTFLSSFSFASTKEFISKSEGYNGELTVKTSFTNNSISNIEVISHKESNFTKRAMKKIINDIIETQSADVDNVGGATYTSKALKNAVNLAIEKSKIKLIKKEIIKKDIENTTTDIVIIGAGGAGLTASIAAKENGANVILVEKMPMIGGNTNYATGGMNAAETSIQKLKGINDSIDIFIEDTLKGGKNTNDKALVTVMAKSSGDMVDWLIERGADLSDIGRLGGQSIDRTHRPKGGKPVGPNIIDALSARSSQLGVDLRTSTKATKILTDKNNNIIGIEVIAPNGKSYNIYAKAVILTTGGFGANQDLVVKYNKNLSGFGTTNHKGASGDAINLTLPLNVDLVQMEEIQTHPTVIPSNSVMITEAVRGNGAILINRSGKRFINELETRDIVSKAELEQEGQSAYLVFDESVKDSLKAIDSYYNKGYLTEGNSIEELAKKLNISEKTFKNSIEEYNNFVKNNKDILFNRQSLVRELNKAPFYAVEVAPAVHHTMGGLKINKNGQVLRNNKPIKGLYAAGEVTGGIHGSNRLGGNAVIDIVVFGKIAGENAAKSLNN
ncbi:flavocytochrome c [Cetobacterium sp. SF1]|uniref:flavocytochrome c n=1 Tax=unclassified Cetobacterium TaxID=2630983 RepID=UPI003CE8E25C